MTRSARAFAHENAAGPPIATVERTREWFVTNGLLAIIGLAFLAPMLWLALAAVDANAGWALQLPHFTLANLIAVTRGDYLQALLNTLEISLVATGVSTIAGVFGGYALSRRDIPLSDELMVGVLFLTGIPVAIMIVPVFQVFAKYDLLSLVPTGVFLGVTSLPFALWLIKTAIDAVPKELEEAATIEARQYPAGHPSRHRSGCASGYLRGRDLQLYQCMGRLLAAIGANQRPIAGDRAVEDLRSDWLRGGPLRGHRGIFDCLFFARYRALHSDVAALQRWVLDGRRCERLGHAINFCTSGTDCRAEERPRIGLVTEALLKWPLHQVIDWISEEIPEIEDLEVGTGGYAPSNHCDMPRLLADGQARRSWLGEMSARGLRVSALNVWGNPLHPDKAIAVSHDTALRDTIKLAAELGIDRVVAMAGVPPVPEETSCPISPAADGFRISKEPMRDSGKRMCSPIGERSTPLCSAPIRAS